MASGWQVEIQPPATFDLEGFMDFAIAEMASSRVNRFVNRLKVIKIK